MRVGKVRDLSSAPSARALDHELCLRADPKATRVARHWVMRVAAGAGIGGTLNQVIEVLTGDLVADAMRLGGADCQVQVGVRFETHGVRVAVTGPGVLVPTQSTATSLALVEALATEWGTWPQPDGSRTVWFEVDT